MALATLAGSLGTNPSVASAHGGNPALAAMQTPRGVGTVVDETFELRWVDADKPIPTGTATVDLFYTATRPPSFSAGEIHPLLEGTPIVQGVLEKDPANRHAWDTRTVPAGSYFVWSRVVEPPEEFMAPQIISFSPGVLTIAHPGDEIHPAIRITRPDSPFRYADDRFDIAWDAFDPDDSGRVRLEVGTSSLGEGYQVLADDLPATPGWFEWDTRALAETDWRIRATLTDARGLSFTTYADYPLLVTHLGLGRDGGSGSDAGPPPDGTGSPNAPSSSGCRGTRRALRGSASWPGLTAVILVGVGVGLRRLPRRRTT